MNNFAPGEKKTLEIYRTWLPVLCVDVSDNVLPKAVEAIVDWMEATDGLPMPDCSQTQNGVSGGGV